MNEAFLHAGGKLRRCVLIIFQTAFWTQIEGGKRVPGRLDPGGKTPALAGQQSGQEQGEAHAVVARLVFVGHALHAGK